MAGNSRPIVVPVLGHPEGQLTFQQGRTNDLHAMPLKARGIIDLSIRLARFLEETLNLGRWREGEYHASGLLTKVSPNVRDISRGQNRIAWFQLQLCFADLHQYFVATFDEVEPFLLLVMHMSRWSSADHIAVLHNEEGSVSFARKNLEVQMGVGTRSFVRPPCAISTCFNQVNRALFFVCNAR